jgi:hypothetical protein
MSVLPLGHGFKTNIRTIKNNPSNESVMWWRILSESQKADLIIKQYPNCINQSILMRMSLYKVYTDYGLQVLQT